MHSIDRPLREQGGRDTCTPRIAVPCRVTIVSYYTCVSYGLGRAAHVSEPSLASSRRVWVDDEEQELVNTVYRLRDMTGRASQQTSQTRFADHLGRAQNQDRGHHCVRSLCRGLFLWESPETELLGPFFNTRRREDVSVPWSVDPHASFRFRSPLNVHVCGTERRVDGIDSSFFSFPVCAPETLRPFAVSRSCHL